MSETNYYNEGFPVSMDPRGSNGPSYCFPTENQLNDPDPMTRLGWKLVNEIALLGMQIHSSRSAFERKDDATL